MLWRDNHGALVVVGARAYSIAPLQWRVLDVNAPIMVENGKVGAQWNKPGCQPSVNRRPSTIPSKYHIHPFKNIPPQTSLSMQPQFVACHIVIFCLSVIN